MKALIDTNIALDVALERDPFFDESEQIFALIEDQKLEGYFSASTISDFYYLVRKARGHDWTLAFLRQLLSFCQVASVDRSVIESALASSFKDFEDAIQEYAAVESQLDAIVTRNPKDFAQSSLSVLTPEQLLERLVAGEQS